MVASYIGDAVWVIALSVMFSASTRASNRTAGDSHVPMLGRSLPRNLALWSLPGGAFAISLWFAYAARTADMGLDGTVVLLGVRCLSSALVTLAHLTLLAGVFTPPRR